MTSKVIEIRDSGTFIPALVFRLEPKTEQERWLLSSAGFGTSIENQKMYIFLAKINGGEPYKLHSDPSSWSHETRTMREAHRWLEQHFDEVKPGDVVDVRYIIGLTDKPSISDRYFIPPR